jgi:hypothetical protein
MKTHRRRLPLRDRCLERRGDLDFDRVLETKQKKNSLSFLNIELQ